MTGDTTTTQQFIKQRLQKLKNLPENQICSDCSAKRPTWASLIIPPQDAPTELQIIVGAFVCFQCSGIHRGLGTHVCFVRSVNLDEWKEKEVIAMEMGGNDRVNAIFEAKDIHINGVDSIKLDHMADMETRKKFIQDKYVNKLYFNAFYYDRVLRESTRATSATPTHIEDLVDDEDDVDHTFDANWEHHFEKPNNADEDDQEEEPTSSSTTTEHLETPSAIISSKSQQQQQQQRDRASRSMSRSSTHSGDSSTRRRSRSRSQKRRSRSKGGGGGGGRRHRSSRQGDDDKDKSLKRSSTHGSTCSSAATSDDSSDDDDDASSFGNDDEPSSTVGGGDKDKKHHHHHSLGGYTTSSSTQNRSRVGVGGKPKDPLSVSGHGSVGGGGARMRRQLAAGIKLQRATSLRTFGGGGGGSSIGSSGRGGIQLGGDLGDDNNDSNSVSNRRSSSHRRSGGLDSLSVSEHGGRPRGLDSLSVSEHGGSSSGRPRIRRQMPRQRIPTRSKSDFDDSHSLPTVKAGSDGRRHRDGFGDVDEEEEEEMVHVIQNPLSVTSEPVLSGGPKKAGTSLFGTKNNSRSGMRRQSSSNRLRSSNKSSLDRSRHSSDLDDDQGEIGKSSSHSRPPMRRMGSVRTKGGERNNSVGSSKRGQKDCFGEGVTKSNDEEEEDFVHFVVGSELDSDAENDDGDDDNHNTGRRSRSRTSGSRRGGDGGGGISADRKARSIERARGRERKKSTPEKSNEVDEEPVEAADQAQTDASEKKKPKNFDFATKRKARPRSYDAKSNRRRHPLGRSDATKTATTRGGEDGKQEPQDVTNVFKAPIGQSVHSQDSGFSSGDESFLNFGEEDLFDEERRPNPISQRVVMSSSMNSSFGSIDSFADTPEIENKVLIEVPVDP